MGMLLRNILFHNIPSITNRSMETVPGNVLGTFPQIWEILLILSQEIIKYFPYNYIIYVPHYAHEKTALIKIPAHGPGNNS